MPLYESGLVAFYRGAPAPGAPVVPTPLFRNATAWSRTPKMFLIKHEYHMPSYQAKISYIPKVNIGVLLVSVQLEFSTI